MMQVTATSPVAVSGWLVYRECCAARSHASRPGLVGRLRARLR